MTETKSTINETELQLEIFETVGWTEFYHDNLNIIADIVDIFNRGTYGFIRHNNMLGLTTQYIALALGKPVIYIRHQLSIWYTSSCTFYAQHGRINYNHEKKIWFYEPKS